MPNGKLCHHVKEWPQVILSSHFLPNKHTKLKIHLYVLFLQTSTTLGDLCSYAYFQGWNLLEVWIYLSSNSSKDHRCCIFFRMARDGVCQWTKTTHSLKAFFSFFIDNSSECDTHLILMSIYWSIAHSASETCWVPCLKEKKNFTMSEITRELREVKVVVHDHWKDSTDKKQHTG